MPAEHRMRGFSNEEAESSASTTKSSPESSESIPTDPDQFPNETKTAITDAQPMLLDRLTLGHYTMLIWWAYRHTLQLKELVPLRREYSTAYCWKRLHQQFCRSTSSSEDETKTTPSAEKLPKESKEPGICTSIMRAFWGFIAFSSMMELLFDFLRLTPVYILSRMINFVSSDEPDSTGYLLCAAMFGLAIVTSFVLNGIVYTSCCGGVQIRSALLAAIYRKCLVASNEATQQFTSGDLMNMMSVDVDNVYQFTTFSTLIWGGLIRILTSVAIIWYYLGPSSLSGLGVIAAGIPITVLLSNAVAKFQENQMAEKDKRLDILNEILAGIKIIKMYAWEVPFINKVQTIRERETDFIRKYLLGQTMISFVWYCSPFLVAVAAFGTYVFASEEHILTPDRAFVSLFLFNNMRFSLTFLPMIVTMMLKALVSLERIRKYLLCEEIHKEGVTHYVKESEDIRLSNASLSWGNITPTLAELNLTVERGKLIAVVGRVGSGKSSLLSAILGEMKKLDGTLDVRKAPIAYVPQQAWIQNETVRQNITFIAKYEKAWYRKVIENCCMEPDLKLLPAGDLTEIGEKGVNLSGGQKQRISMARAVYQQASIYLLDDPLSAVDAHVSAQLFRNVIGPGGLLKECTRILVTHSVSVLPFADRIIILEDGRISHSGTYQEIQKMDIKLKNFLAEPRKERAKYIKQDDAEEPVIDSGSLRSLSSRTVSRSSSHLDVDPNALADEQTTSKGLLIADESMETGGVKMSIYFNVIKHFGLSTAFISVAGFTAYRIADVYSTMWLSQWSNDGMELLKRYNLTDLRSGTGNHTDLLNEIQQQALYRIWIYLSIGGLEALTVIVATLALAIGCLAASSTLHREMLWAIMKAPMEFFDATPLGRIINRFGKDVDVLDLELYIHIEGWMDTLFQAVATIILICIEIPFFLVFVFPIWFIFHMIQKIYMTASRQIRRLQSISRSPVLNNFSETLNGVSSIRAYGVQEYFFKKCQIRVDLNQNCYFHALSINRWGALRMEWLSAIISTLTCCLIVFYRREMSPGVAGLVLSYALSICDAVSWLLRVATDVENAVVAAERVDEYSKVKGEAPWTRPDGPVLDGNWPQNGEVAIVDYSTRYREGMELVLKDINIEIHSGEKVGIVGRTGAGKSSLTLALFRIIEPSSGRIIIDEVNIGELGLHDVRSRITMIPQDPVLFRGTVRSNIDPHSIYSDEQLYVALERAHIKRADFPLEHNVAQGGSNLSVGERQLLCLARALLRKSKIILLDEATAAVDMETDALIQGTIRKDFSDCTIITIAHRLNTVLDYDTIIVLAEGRIIEKGSPQKLLADKESQFHSMAAEAGLIH